MEYRTGTPGSKADEEMEAIRSRIPRVLGGGFVAIAIILILSLVGNPRVSAIVAFVALLLLGVTAFVRRRKPRS